MAIADIAKILKKTEADCAYLEPLSGDEQEQLASQLRAARKAQHEHMVDATKAAVNQLPRLMRKPVMKMFEGL